MTGLIRISAPSEKFTSSLPLGSASFVRLRFGSHFVWVQLNLTPYGEDHWLSHTRWLRCCESGPKKKELDDFLDDLHETRFGKGRWLNIRRRQLEQSLSSLPHQACAERDDDAISLLSSEPSVPSPQTPEPSIPSLQSSESSIPSLQSSEPSIPSLQSSEPSVPSLQSIEQDVPSLQSIEQDLGRLSTASWVKGYVTGQQCNEERPTEQPSTEQPSAEQPSTEQPSTEQPSTEEQSQARNKKRTRDTDELVSLRKLKKRAKTVKIANDLEKKQLRKLLVDTRDAECLERFVSEVKHGIGLLKKRPELNARLKYQPFAQLIQHRDDDWIGLCQVLSQLNKIGKTASDNNSDEWKRVEWTNTLLWEGIRLKERRLNPAFSSSGDLGEKELKRQEKRCEVLCRIVNKLHSYVGGHAWGVISALRAANAVIADTRFIQNERLNDFVNSAVDRLKYCQLETIPDDVPTVHIPAILSWIQTEVTFPQMCAFTDLTNFGPEDPHLEEELDKLELEFSELALDAPTFEDRSMELEAKAAEAMMMPLSRLRDLHLRVTQPGCCNCIQHAPAKITTQPPNVGSEGSRTTPRRSPEPRSRPESISARRPNSTAGSENNEMTPQGPETAESTDLPEVPSDTICRASLPPPTGPELNGPELPHYHSERPQQPQDQESTMPQVTTATEFTVPMNFSPWTPGLGPCSENTESLNQSLSHQATGSLRPLQQQDKMPDRPSSRRSSSNMAIRNILGGPPNTQPHQFSSTTGISEQRGSLPESETGFRTSYTRGHVDNPATGNQLSPNILRLDHGNFEDLRLFHPSTHEPRTWAGNIETGEHFFNDVSRRKGENPPTHDESLESRGQGDLLSAADRQAPEQCVHAGGRRLSDTPAMQPSSDIMRFQDPVTNGIQLSLGNDTDVAAGQEPTTSSSQGGYNRQPAFFIDDPALSATFGTLFEINTDDLFMDQDLPFLDLNNQ